MALFPYTVELADGRKLTITSADHGAAFALVVEGEAPAPIERPEDLEAISLILEYAATKARNHRDQTDEADTLRARPQ